MIINSNNLQTYNCKPSFGTLIPRQDALAILKNQTKLEGSARASLARTCFAIVGPEIYEKGLNGVLNKCAYALKKQFVGLEEKPDKFEKLLDVQPLYTETEDTQHWLRESQIALTRLLVNGANKS